MGDLVKSDFGQVLTTASLFAAGTLVGGPAAGFAAASTFVGVSAQRQAAGAREVELELAQRQETTAARDRAVQRKRRLAAVLGAQSAQAAASGLSMSGSVANISLTDARRAGEDSAIDSHNTRLRIDALKRNRASVSRLSRMRTATTILGAGERIAARG